MFFLGVLMLGFISLTRLPQELFPSITYPQLTIVTAYENAAPEEVETLITKIIEETVGTVSGLKRISSVSKEGLSIVTAEFGWGTSMDFASLGVREKIDLIKERLPLGSTDPIVMKFNPFEMPVITLSITGDKLPYELLRLSRKFIKDELEKVEGVASCNISGGLEREILVSLDEGRLRASNISITKVVDALRSSNLNYPAGTIEEPFYEYLVRTIGEFELVSDIGGTIVGKDEEDERGVLDPRKSAKLKKEARLIYLDDIAEIEDTFQERTSISRYDGQENISIAVQKQAGSNTLRVAQNVKDKLLQIEEELPRGMKAAIVYDQSVFIERSIRGVMEAAIQGGFLAFLVLFIFLRNIKASLIVALSMPISIMVAFSLMYFNGITLNMLSLGGLALGIGMLVDSAIVVIENIYSHFQKEKDIKEAAKFGASEVSGAIFSSTLTTVAVFLPMIFVVGVAGQLFKELAFTVTFSLLASLIVALSLIPRLAAIGGKSKKSKAPKKVVDKDAAFILGSLYSKAIAIVLKYRWMFLIGVVILFFLSMGLFGFIDKEFMPKVDQREFIIKLTMPTGTKLNITDSVVKRIEEVLFDTKEVEGVAVNIGSSKSKDYSQGLETMGSHQSQIAVTLNKDKKSTPSSKVIENLKDRFHRLNLEGAQIEYILQESVFTSALQGSAPIVIEVKGKDLGKIETFTNYIKDGLAKIHGIYGIRTSLTVPSPETKVNVIKDRAALYNLSIGAIARTANIAIKGIVATRFKEEGREIDVRVRLRKGGDFRLSRLRNILIHSPLDIEVPLSEVAYITQGVGPNEIKRLDQQRVVLVTANITDTPLNKVIMDITALIEKIEIEKANEVGDSRDTEKDIVMSLSGESQQMRESFDSLRFALILSILMVYMIMAAQFESLWQPFIIMFTVPLSLIGVLAILFLTRTPISVVVMLGVIILGGIVVNNGIILIDCINNLRKKGVELLEAVIESAKTRLRPIFMTTMTTVLGLLPLALGISEGSELQSPMAITVMGGLMISTILTLFVIPCVYIIVAALIERSPVLKIAPVLKLQPALKPVIEKKVKAIPLPSPPEFKREIPGPKIKPSIIEKVPTQTDVGLPSPAAVAEPLIIETSLPGLNKRQKQLLEHLKKVKRITRKEYAVTFKISVPTAARDLKELLSKGMIIAKGPLGPGRWYELKS
ncbi:MAG: efflux RND transporter permease subunit [Candidatus Omnitrophica bacterium]|nr:efflux RND transporter permease subunit [Candidatus Omnitrophota bacterium]